MIPFIFITVAAAALGVLLYAVATRRRSDPDDRDRTAEYLAKVSHELRTPLTSVIGILSVLADHDVALDDAERDELIQLAGMEAARLSHLVENVHSVSRVARNVLEPTIAPLPILDAVEHTLRQFPDAERRTFVWCDPELVVDADPNLLGQILTNLLQNAQRYAPDGELEIGCEVDDGAVVLYVSDDGPGVPADRREAVFSGVDTSKGLGLGLRLSRDLARAMSGDLDIVAPRRSGATFALRLPRSDADPVPSVPDRTTEVPGTALSPRARVLVDIAAVLEERSLDRMVIKLQGLYSDLLGADKGVLLVRESSGVLTRAGDFGTEAGISIEVSDPLVAEAAATGRPVTVGDLADVGAENWVSMLGCSAAILLPVIDDGRLTGILAVGWAHKQDLPGSAAVQVAAALADLAGFAIHRHSLAADAAYERHLRASVMESLPIAISVFADDPPRVVDWNARERELLGIDSDVERPEDLAASQAKFDVRFADGTPLTEENAPVLQAIRTGKGMGPFLLMVRRADGSQVTTRTYCAPFRDGSGTVIGAVVTSEELDVIPGSAAPGRSQPKR